MNTTRRHFVTTATAAGLLTSSLVTWLLVAVPLGWGITKSVQKSLPLFQGAAAKSAASAAAPGQR